ncbi:XRE family transcriptional regulator [Geoanaerobacter pelophilus]|uniref:XRE family transcriptional regulator n=1 Tax=Geoanaerobacter pelophilus TaxID=60036 RepID=A0ABQ0MNV2_9BACT|nr:XRE family transcriptional regulator [Geoanaerobacter pelophilus]
MSQEKLAEMVGVSFQQIQKYENGHTTLNIIKLQHIAAALRVSVADFFDLVPVKGVRLTGEEDQLLQAFRKVKSGELRECILKLVENMNKRAR